MVKSITVEKPTYQDLTQNIARTARIEKNNEQKKDSYELECTKTSKILNHLRNEITEKCVKIADEASFSTEYEDVYDHLFGGDYEMAFVRYKGELKGFAIFDLLEIEGKRVLHLHGIIIHPSVQSHGNTKRILEMKIKSMKPDILTFKTHNPRMYAAGASFTKGLGSVYPNFKNEVPEEIVDLCRKNHFISGCDDRLVVRNAYSDEKLQQSVDDKNILKGFEENVGPLDAQVVLVKFNKGM